MIRQNSGWADVWEFPCGMRLRVPVARPWRRALTAAGARPRHVGMALRVPGGWWRMKGQGEVR